MTNPNAAKRKKLYLVNRDFQLRYTGVAVIVGFASTVLTVLLILFPLYQFEILRIPRFLPWPILAMMAVAALANIFLVGILGIFITHRIAGPMYSLVREFRKIEEGSWAGQMRQRDGDDMRYVVRNFNAMLASLTERLHQDINALKSAEEQLLAAGDTDSAVQTLTTLRHNLEVRLAEDPPTKGDLG